MLIQKFVDDSLPSGTIQLDYKSGGIGLAPLADFVPASVSEAFLFVKSDIEDGAIKVEPFTE